MMCAQHTDLYYADVEVRTVLFKQRHNAATVLSMAWSALLAYELAPELFRSLRFESSTVSIR
jgi:hypothetical protein